MSCNFIIDAYAWIEYFKASEMGERAREYIESERSITPTIVVAEISRKLSQQIQLGKETPEGRQRLTEFIRATSRIADLDFDTAIDAGKNIEEMAKGCSLADLIILSTARKAAGKVITGDDHFRGLKDVIFLK
ncbi:MAG TPA: PIN domain-containing protein [Candidatus Limnocylindrales bacterium]|nr:PIN domain-containing protein [Candidatus Limnocylindrales bacterium]